MLSYRNLDYFFSTAANPNCVHLTYLIYEKIKDCKCLVHHKKDFVERLSFMLAYKFDDMDNDEILVFSDVFTYCYVNKARTAELDVLSEIGWKLPMPTETVYYQCHEQFSGNDFHNAKRYANGLLYSDLEYSIETVRNGIATQNKIIGNLKV